MSADFVDTNVILYSLSDEATKRRQALVILAHQPVLSLQVLNEAANVMRRKLGFEIPAIREVLLRLVARKPVTPFSALNPFVCPCSSGSLWAFPLR